MPKSAQRAAAQHSKAPDTGQTRATHWPYQAIRPLLLQAGEPTPIEKTERRVLVLANPGHGLEKNAGQRGHVPRHAIAAARRMGALAPPHPPNAVRMVVEGTGAWSDVDGEKCEMQRGDLILTPTGLWHEHGHDGTEPVVWLDALDLPLVHYLEANYHVNGRRQEVKPERSEHAYARGGLVPTPVFERRAKAYPMLRHP